MKHWLKVLLVICAYGLLPAQQAQAETELSIMTGRESGTYYQIGKDIQNLLKQQGFDINVIPSSGSVENVLKLYEFSSIQLAITQLDTLTFESIQPLMQRQGVVDELQNIIDSIQLVMPLYQEEVHVLVRDEIKDISELNGKKIALGRKISGSHGTALTILRMFEVNPEETYHLSPEQALPLLKEGKLDAMIYVVGVPSAFFAEQIKAEDKLHLLALDLDKISDTQVLKSLYQRLDIAANTYAWQTEAVPTVAITNLLITTRSEDCQAVGEFFDALYQGLAWLRTHGHEKWASVQIDPERLLENKSLSPCVANVLRKKAL